MTSGEGGIRRDPAAEKKTPGQPVPRRLRVLRKTVNSEQRTVR
jgi:hypothetical protein